MCELDLPRYMMINHRQDLSQDFVALDLFLNDSVPNNYRVISVTADKVVTDTVVMVYNVLLEQLQ